VPPRPARAPRRALRGENRVAGELHRDGAAALADAAGRDVAEQRAYEPLPVDTRVGVEAGVLRGQERIDDRRRDFLVGKRNAALLAELRDELVVA
jgi:hypothetical protein